MAEGVKRRPVLKGIGTAAMVAAALPKSWTKPVVQSVLIPAHAATSPLNALAPATTTPSPTTTPQVFTGGITNVGVVRATAP